MRQVHSHRQARSRLWTGLVLGLLLVRAYVPVGFMPAHGRPFALEICPDGLGAPLPAAHMAHVHHPGMVMPTATPDAMPKAASSGNSHHGDHEHFEHCPFGSLPATGPVAASIGIQPATVPATIVSAFALPLLFDPTRDRAHLPRGPPSPA